MARLALAIAYDGTRFDSYARQPGRRTVEGELVALLARAGAVPDPRAARFRSGSRTDAGVSAARNVVAFDTGWSPPAVVALTARAPEGLHLLSAARVAPRFEPRHARSRTYRYVLDTPWEWKRVRPAAKLFVGEHDFSNFRRADASKAPHARIASLRYRAAAPGPWLEVTAPYFLWHQVRRIVAALHGVHERRHTVADVRRALEEPGRRADLGLAAPENLVLVRVDYADVAFPEPPRVVRERLADEAAGLRRRAVWLAAIRGEPKSRRSWNR